MSEISVPWKGWQGVLGMIGAFLLAGSLAAFLGLPAPAASALLGAAFIFVAWLLARPSQNPFRTLGFRAPNQGWWIYFLGALLVFWTASALTSLLGPESDQKELLVDLGPLPLQILLVVIVAPVAEEIIFRGVIFAGFLKKMPLLLAAFLSAVIFALPHLPSGAVLLPLIGGLGFILALLYYKTDSLGPPIILHATNNAIALIALQ